MPAPVSSANPGRIDLPVGDARCDQHAVRAQRAAAARSTIRPAPSTRRADGVLHGQQLGAEPAGLVGRAAGQIRAAQSCREAQVVLDAARLTGLPARRLALDQHGAESLRRSVDGGGQAGRAAADDHEVVVVLRRLRRDSESAGELEDRGLLEHTPSSSRATGRRASSTPMTCSSSRASPSRSTSSQRAGTPLRARKSRRSCVALEKRCPISAHAAGLEERARLPGGEQILEHREELLLGRIPRLEQVVVERDLVDRRDRGVGVGVGGQQHALGV